MVRSRRCQHPHMLPVASLLSSGDDSVRCSGTDKEIKLCNKQACGGGRRGWREEECAKYDNSVHAGQRYTWQPFIHPSDPCKLTCRAKGHHFYSNLADRVVDGTPCAGATNNPSAVCVQGRCQEVGCDDVVSSPWRRDACGVCRGDNSTCRKISGIFARQDLTRGMNEIVVIPAGSTLIRIKGLRYSTNLLALQTTEGDNILNGGEQRSQGKEFEAAGTMFTYKTKRRCAGQCLVAKGPTDQTLKLMLNTRGRNRGIMYSFNVPINVSDGYFRRIIDTARPRAGLVKSAILPPAEGQQGVEDGGRKSRGHGYVQSHSKGSNSSSDNSNGNNNNNEGPKPSPLKDKDGKESVDQAIHRDGDDFSDAADNNDNVPVALAEGEETVDSLPIPDHNSDDQQPSAVDNNKDEPLDSNSQIDDEVGAPEPFVQRVDSSGHMKITKKEKPRFIDDYDRTNGLSASADNARTFEFQSNAHRSMYNREGEVGISHETDTQDSSDIGTTPTVGQYIEPGEAESYADGINQDTIPYISDAMSDPSADHSDATDSSVPSSDSLHLPQSDSPTPRYYKSYRSRARQNRNRLWSQFRRPKYSQSFTFRRRPKQSDDAEGSSSHESRPAYTAVVQTANNRRIRYRQQPQRQGSEGGRSLSLSAYGQSSSRRNAYSSSGSSSYAYNRRTPSQRQALTAGQSGFQDQDRNLQSRNGNSQSQRGNAHDSNAPQQAISSGRENSAQQRKPSSQLEEYRRQLARRRQLIEQQIATQNAEYQRRLEERNQRLKQQHLERQQHKNNSHISRQPLSPGIQERRRLSQERTVQPPVSASGGSPTSAHNAAPGASSRQPDDNPSPQRTPNSRLTPSSGLNSKGDNVESIDRKRPLIISNRRQGFQQEKSSLIPPARQSGVSSSGSGYAGSRPSSRQPDASASSQRIDSSRFTPSSGPSSVGGSNPDSRRPLIISNRRQDLSSKDRSPVASPVSPPRAVPGLSDNAGSIGLPPSSSQAGTVENLDRRRPLVISNRKQTPQQGKTSVTPPLSPSGGLLSRTDNVGIGAPVIPSSSVDGNRQHSDGRRPLIISNRRQTPQQGRNPLTPPLSPPGGLPGLSDGVGIGATNAPVIPSSVFSRAAGNLEHSDGRRPRIISNRRQDPQQGRSSLRSSASPSRGPPGPNAGSAGLPLSSSQTGADHSLENLERKRPRIISNRRQTPQQGRSPVVSSGRTPGYLDSAGRGASNSRLTPSPVLNSLDGNVDNVDGRRPLIISNRRQSPEQGRNPLASSVTPSGVRPGRVDSAASGGLIPRVSSVPGPISLDSNPENVDRRQPLIISNRRQDPAIPGGAVARRQPSISETGPESGVHSGRRAEDRYRASHIPAPAVAPGQQPVSPDLIPNTASLGGGFVPPQYIPETGSQYRSHPGLPASSPDQLPSSPESPLVIGAGASAVPGVLESGAAIGGGGSALAIGETDDVTSYEWRVSGLTECTLTCGGGMQQTVVVCLDTRTQAFVTDDNCQHVQKPQTKALTCNTRPCPAQWVPGKWSACSVSCGHGEQTRLVSCVARISATLNVTMGDENCQLAQKPELRRACQNEACNKWNVGNWSQCSVHCGEGVKTRDVYCTDQTGFDVSDDLCSGSGSKPSTEEACVMEACGKGWYHTEWPEQCPVRCGSGTKKRHVACVGEDGAAVSESSCDLASRPHLQQACSAHRSCGGEWFTGEWSKCNVTCGKGYQERDVICMKGVLEGVPSMVEEDNCAPEEKPTNMQPCEKDVCASEWYMTSWSQCSQSCGSGQRTREVKCLDPHQRPSSGCPLAEKPASREVCNTASCVTTPSPSAKAPACRDTFSRCQLVKHARMCRFPYYRKKCCATCGTNT